jgi:hypothetical protein
MIKRRTTLKMMAGTALIGLSADRAAVAATVSQLPQSISIIGTGQVGSCLGMRWSALGCRIVYGSRTPAQARVQMLAAKTGGGARVLSIPAAASANDLILLAVPWHAIDDLAPVLAPLKGKVLLDIMNPVKIVDHVFQIPDGATTSTAETLQAKIPHSAVVKAFNTLSVEVMADPAVGGGAVSVPLAGEDIEAKRRVAALAQAMGLSPLDVGPVYLARYLEGMARLRMTYKAKHPDAFECFLRLHSLTPR